MVLILLMVINLTPSLLTTLAEFLSTHKISLLQPVPNYSSTTKDNHENNDLQEMIQQHDDWF